MQNNGTSMFLTSGCKNFRSVNNVNYIVDGIEESIYNSQNVSRKEQQKPTRWVLLNVNILDSQVTD